MSGRDVMLAVAIVFAVGATPASAGTYTVWSCRDAADRPAAIGDSDGGWTASGLGPGRDALNLCDSSSPRLVSKIDGPWPLPVGTAVSWQFRPPASTYVSAMEVVYSGYARPFNGQNEGVVEVWGSNSGRVALHQGVGPFGPTVVARVGIHDTWLSVRIYCDGPAGSPDCQPGQSHASADIWRSKVTLADEVPPGAGPVTGSAAASSTWQGTQLFAFPATDEGGGVYEAIVDVDGRVAFARTVDDWGGRCVDVAAGGRVFRFPQPCPTSIDALIPVDANTLPAGDHDVTLRISDAAGNLHTVYSARKTIVAPGRRIGPGSDPGERGAANGENAADDARLTVRWARTKRATLTSPYGRRNVIRGRLATSGHVGIRNARIELLTAIDGRKGAPIDKGGARTRDDGRFTVILPRNVSSRKVVLRYRSHANDTVAVAERSLRLKVKAGVRLTVAPRVAAKGHAIRLIGRLIGRPLPARGKVVELQARSRGERWITFRTIRARPNGHFATRYTFKRGGPATYLMRARVRAADDYPYATGASRSVGVRVR